MREINLPNYKKEQSLAKKVLTPFTKIAEYLLIAILVILNFVLRQIVRFSMKRIKGIWFLLLILYMATIFVLMILIHREQLKMYQTVSLFEETNQTREYEKRTREEAKARVELIRRMVEMKIKHGKNSLDN